MSSLFKCAQTYLVNSLWGSWWWWDKGKNPTPPLLLFILFLKFQTFNFIFLKIHIFSYGVGIECHLCQWVFEQEGYACRAFQPIYKWKFLKCWGQVKWRFKVSTKWSGLSVIKNDTPYIFIDPEACITTKVQCQDEPHGLLWCNFISSLYHSYPLYFASTNMFTFTWHINTFYPSIASSTTSYFAPNSVHGGPPFSHLHVLCPICHCLYVKKAWLTCH